MSTLFVLALPAWISSPSLYAEKLESPQTIEPSDGTNEQEHNTNTATQTQPPGTQEEQMGSGHNSQTNETETETNTSDEDSSGHLKTTQLRSCEAHQQAVNTITGRIVERGQNQEELFNTIAQRVETFADQKNITVSNLSALKATLQADETKVNADLAGMKNIQTFNCSAMHPKGVVTAFKGDLQQEISDLQAVKTDVKNLIVAVKTAAGNTSTSTGGNQ